MSYLCALQMLITSSQIQWTGDCEKALDRGDKKGLKSLKKKQVHTLFVELIEDDIAHASTPPPPPPPTHTHIRNLC